MNTKEMRKGFGSAGGTKAQLLAYHAALNGAVDQFDRLHRAGSAVIAAFEEMGRTKSVAKMLSVRQKCEGAMLALKKELEA